MLQTNFFSVQANAVAFPHKGKRVGPGTDPYLFATGHTHLPSGQWAGCPVGTVVFDIT